MTKKELEMLRNIPSAAEVSAKHAHVLHRRKITITVGVDHLQEGHALLKQLLATHKVLSFDVESI